MKKTYYVYRHICPNGMIYVGITSQNKLYRRWKPSKYKTTSLYSYIELFGWDAIKHEIIYTCEDREEALQVEDEMICYWREKGICINKQRSGLIRVTDNHYYDNVILKSQRKMYIESHQEEIKEYQRVYRLTHQEERKIYNKEYYQRKIAKIKSA